MPQEAYNLTGKVKAIPILLLKMCDEVPNASHK
jgi:hypothetical protein